MSQRRRSVRADARLGVVILAAGRSKRFRSEVPKVLHPAAGRPLVVHVLEMLRALHRSVRLRTVCVVVPPGGQVEAALEGFRFPFDVRFAVQRQPKGTGDATRCGLAELDGADEVLVLAGDAPLVRASSLKDLVRKRRRHDAAVAVLTAVLDEPASYGRIVRADGQIARIVEARDATAAERRIDEINTSTYVFDHDALTRTLPKVRDANAQGEYYLTDAVGLIAGTGAGVVGVEGEPEDALGTNTRAEFAEVTARLRRRVIEELMAAGVTVVDPGSTYVDAGVRVGADSVLLPNTFLEGATKVGRGCEVGPNVRLVDTTVGDGSHVTFAVARDTRIGPECEVGPFASLRAGTRLARGAKAGTFVETKNAEIGEGTKVPHLSYMGDVTIGRGSNVGAGTITCNYDPFKPAPDGSTKHHTKIGDDVFIGSDTMLVAPVRLGDGSRTGAGSVVTRNVGEGQLVVGAPAEPRSPGGTRKRASGKGGSRVGKKTVRGRRSRKDA